jgi:protein TonB
MALLRLDRHRAHVSGRFALVVSLAVHGGLAAGAAALATQPPSRPDEPITVAILSETQPVVLVPDELAAVGGRDVSIEPVSRPLAPMPTARRRVQELPPTREKPVPESRTADAEAPAALKVDESDEASDGDDDARPVLAANSGVSAGAIAVPGGHGTGTSGGVGSPGTTGGSGAGTGVGTRPLSSAERRALLDRYLKLIDPRIRQHFRYPRQAEALELEGDVRIVLAVDSRGQLLRAHTAGTCPHLLLCEDATRTVRAAVPFPRPPPELGGVVELELPLTYRLE